MIESADVVIVAAGESRRMGGGRSKLLRPLGGKPLLAYTLSPFEQAEEIRRIVIVCRADDRDEIKALVRTYRISKAAGFLPPRGAARADSVYAGLSYLKANSAPDWVLVQDGARPFVEIGLIRVSIQSARETGAAVVAIPFKDTVKEANAKGFLARTLDRERLWRIQTPQTFRFDLLLNAYEHLPEGDRSRWTDDAMVAEAQGIHAAIVPGSDSNLKITTPEDFAWAEFLLSRNSSGITRAGAGP